MQNFTAIKNLIGACLARHGYKYSYRQKTFFRLKDGKYVQYVLFQGMSPGAHFERNFRICIGCVSLYYQDISKQFPNGSVGLYHGATSVEHIIWRLTGKLLGEYNYFDDDYGTACKSAVSDLETYIIPLMDSIHSFDEYFEFNCKNVCQNFQHSDRFMADTLSLVMEDYRGRFELLDNLAKEDCARDARMSNMD